MITFYEGDVMDEVALKAMLEKEERRCGYPLCSTESSRRIRTEAIKSTTVII